MIYMLVILITVIEQLSTATFLDPCFKSDYFENIDHVMKLIEEQASVHITT